MHSCGKRIWAIDLVRKHVESMKKVVGKMDEKSRHCENGPMGLCAIPKYFVERTLHNTKMKIVYLLRHVMWRCSWRSSIRETNAYGLYCEGWCRRRYVPRYLQIDVQERTVWMPLQ